MGLLDAITQGQQTLANSRAAAENRARMERMRSKPKDVFTLVLDGLEVPVITGRVSRSIDTVADGWSAEIAWIPGKDRALDKRVAPYAYTKAQVFLGSTLVNTGRLYTVANNMSATGVTKQLEGWSYTADLVDSHIPPKARDFLLSAGLSVWNICNELCYPLSIGVKTDIGNVVLKTSGQRAVEPFYSPLAEITESYAEFFTRLAFQRGMLVTNDEYGNLFLTAANVDSKPVASLGEGDLAAYFRTITTGNAKSPNWEAKFDGRKRYYSYTVYGQSGMADDISAIETDNAVPKSRIMNTVAGEASAGNAGVIAAWKRSTQLIKALTIPFPVIGWHTPSGRLWTPNTQVMVSAPSLNIDKGFAFLIREVENLHEASGQTSLLQLVPPQAYTGAELVEPWQRWK